MKDKLGFIGPIILILSVVIMAYAAYYYFLYQGFEISHDDDGVLTGVRSGTFGDAFGTLNALFSGLAFSGVLITLFLQRKDLAEQRKDSAVARDLNHRQQAESQFYNMLGLQQQVVQGFDIHKFAQEPNVIQGRDCFRDWGQRLRERYVGCGAGYDFEHTEERALAAYDEIMKSHQGDLGLYFRSLYSVFRFIERSEGASEDFSLVVRSFLSDYELVLLFYNCLSVKGEKFKRFARAYALFDNLDVHLLANEEHVIFMESESYGGNEDALALLEKVKKRRQSRDQRSVV